MLNLQIILGSTRPGRNGEAVAHWVYEIAKQRTDIKSELVDLSDYALPLFDEPVSPAYAPHTKSHSKKWSNKISQADAYIFVTAEYNRGMPGAMKNAIDFLYNEWNNKVAGFVGYGNAGGVRAIEQYRQVMAEIQIADVRTEVALSLFEDFENMSKFTPRTKHVDSLNTQLDQIMLWGAALKNLRKTLSVTNNA